MHSILAHIAAPGTRGLDGDVIRAGQIDVMALRRYSVRSPHHTAIPGDSLELRTRIPVPNAVFDQVERRVKSLGGSRSEVFSRAAERYLLELDRDDSRIDAAPEADDATALQE